MPTISAVTCARWRCLARSSIPGSYQVRASEEKRKAAAVGGLWPRGRLLIGQHFWRQFSAAVSRAPFHSGTLLLETNKQAPWQSVVGGGLDSPRVCYRFFGSRRNLSADVAAAVVCLLVLLQSTAPIPRCTLGRLLLRRRVSWLQFLAGSPLCPRLFHFGRVGSRPGNRVASWLFPKLRGQVLK